MHRAARILPFILLVPTLAQAQTREATMQFITDEFKALGSFTYAVREASFSPDGATFTFRHGHQGHPAKATVIPLAKVDVYCVTVHRANGVDHYNLMVQSRGRDGDFLLNGLRFNGKALLIGPLQNERKARSLEKAFAHLTALATGRENPF